MFRTVLLAFINCLVISTPQLKERNRLRNEFIGEYFLSSSRLAAEISVHLSVLSTSPVHLTGNIWKISVYGNGWYVLMFGWDFCGILSRGILWCNVWPAQIEIGGSVCWGSFETVGFNYIWYTNDIEFFDVMRKLFLFEHFWCNIWAFSSKIHPKIDTFAKIGTRDLTILGAKKVVFWTFW